MKLKSLFFGFVLFLTFILPACGTAQPAATNDNEAERLSTAVAGTLAAITEAPTNTGTPAPTVTPTLAPTRTPGPLRVVYSRAGSTWIWEEGGPPKQLTNNIVDARPRLSADGQLVVFERNNELYAVNSDGSNLHVLVSNSFLKSYIPIGYKFIWAEYYDWKLDTHYVYFTTKTGFSGPDTDKFQYDLFRADADTGEVRQILPPGLGGVPYFSPDGKTIALVQPTAIYLANTIGSGLRKALTFLPVPNGYKQVYFPIVVPLSGASAFRLVLPVDNYFVHPHDYSKLWEIPVSGEPSLVYSFQQDGFPFFGLSPNGKTMTYFIQETEASAKICTYSQERGDGFCPQKQEDSGGILFWSPDNVHFVIYRNLYDNPDEVGVAFYITDGIGEPTPFVTYYWMYWIDPGRYTLC